MKLFCCYTPAHEIVFRKHFLPSVPPSFAVQAEQIELEGPGDYLSPEFLRCIDRKAQLILDSLQANEDEVVAWSDVDIRFFDLSEGDLLADLGAHDIAFQREGKVGAAVNTGFFVCRSNKRVFTFFEKMKELLLTNPAANEQFVVNNLMQTAFEKVSWTHLPNAYYARTQGWPPPRNLRLYHANFTMGTNGVEQKLKQFEELDFLQRFPLAGLLLTSIKHSPKRMKRLLRQTAEHRAQ